jgi:type IV pilus assembly protein PilA
MRLNRDGFTLVELMVVAVIVAILAAVAIPLMSANKTRAMATEAEAGCGTIRTAFRAMYAETSDYSKDLNKADVTASPTSLPGISAGDLDGKYFDDGCYKLSDLAATTYTITCTGAASGTADKADVAKVVVTLNQTGAMTRTLD